MPLVTVQATDAVVTVVTVSALHNRNAKHIFIDIQCYKGPAHDGEGALVSRCCTLTANACKYRVTLPNLSTSVPSLRWLLTADTDCERLQVPSQLQVDKLGRPHSDNGT